MEEEKEEPKQKEKSNEEKPIIEVDLAEEQARKDFIKIREVEKNKKNE